MAKTYTPIANQKLTASAASVTFSSIPAIYTDLVLVTTVIAAAGGVEDYTPLMQVNGDTAANYSTIRLTGNVVSASTQGRTDQSLARIQTDGYLSNTIPQNSIINIMNYANTTTYKTFLQRANQADTVANAAVSVWRNTAAISSIRFYPETGNFGPGSTLTLYGILKA